MNREEIIKMALEALDWEDCNDDAGLEQARNKAITALRQQIALEKMAENERELGIQMQPVKMVAYNCKCGRTMKFESEHGVIAPKREWVELTDEEIVLVCAECAASAHRHDDISYARAIEAKLKEKNT